MIKIRYSELPPGLHARAEAQGRSTVIYLLPGLPAADRRAALHRLRRSGEMGYGPRLPAAGVAAATVLDRVATIARNCARSFRVHPYLLLPPTIIAVTAGLATVLTAAAIAVRPPGRAPSPGPGSSLGVVAPAPAPSGPPARSPGPGHGTSPGPGRSSTGSGRPSRSPRPASSPGRSSSPSPWPSPSGTVVPSPLPPPSSPAPEPTGSGPAEPSPTPSASGACLNIGPLGICLPL